MAVDRQTTQGVTGMKMQRTIIWVTGLLIAMEVAGWADDHGNMPSVSTFYPTGTTGLTGALEIDIDEDWFHFIAAPSLVYTIQINNVSLWDNAFAIKAFAEGSTLRQTNSAFVSSPSRIVWTNNGGVRFYYIGVSAFLEFTTGTYSIAISTNDYDADGDGMADVWEQLQFGTLTNSSGGDVDGDGFTNGDEYKAGTQPTNAVSRLAITNLWRTAGNSAISWPAVAYGIYRIETTTNLRQAVDWTFLSRIYRPDFPGPEQFIDSGVTNQMRHYRVMYEP